jgi:hypothetical protein
MLEHVALNQTRFNTPGVAPDNRGILMGKQGALLFASVDRLVGFFRVFCDESPMDDLYPKLKIHQVRTPLESREFLVLFHASSSYLTDRAARIARLFGGQAFTGSGKHYVKYRDDLSPLGYDIGGLHSESAEFVLYGDGFQQGYARVKDLPFEQLVFRLSLRKIPGDNFDETDRELLWIVAREGLGRSLLGYLWRNRVKCEASRVATGGAGAFHDARAQYLMRVHQIPRRMLDLFLRVPGLEVHRPINDACVVQLGWRHPLRLESCAAVFEKERFYIFSGGRDTVDVLAAPPPLVPAQDLVETGFDLGERAVPPPLSPSAPEKLEVQLKLVPSSAAPRRVTATLVPWLRAEWLKRLVFALPPTLLAGYRAAAIDEGVFVVGEQGIDGLPIGDFFQETAPSIFIPIGFEFLPRVSPLILTEHVGGTSGRYVVFPLGAPKPLVLEHAAFEPLGRRALARLAPVPRARDPRLPPPRTTVPASVVNEELGVFPLWGWKGD